jgi:hypothetical protein
MLILLNAALYQAGWLACALGAALGAPWAGPVAALAIVAWHLYRARRPLDELWLVLAAACGGLLFESALLQSGWIAYPGGAGPGSLAPLWMVTLWGLFATTLNVSLRVLRERPVIAAILGAAFAPLAYYAGERLGALDLVSPVAALAAIAIGWAIAMPVLFAAARRLDGYAA